MSAIHRRSDWALYALFKYFWVLVILPKVVQMACLGALLLVIWFYSFKEKPLDKFTIMQLFFLGIYGVSVVVNTLTGSHETSRILAAVNTWLITAVALGLYHFYRQSDVDLDRVGKYCLCNLLILVLLWIVYKLTHGTRAFAILGHTLMGDDWVNGLYTPRFFGYMDYANLLVFSVLFFYPLAMLFLRGKRILPLLLTVVLYPVVDSTNSRTGVVLYLLLLMAYALFEFQTGFFRLYRRQKYLLFFFALLGVLAVVLLCSGKIAQIVGSILNKREGSNNMRVLIYTQSITTMLEHSPVIGIGIKDMLGEYPLGSHSTYIGVFYKAGILGGLIYLCAIIYMAIKIILGKDMNRHAVTAKICLAAALLLMALEDVDGANWCICVFYILLALLQNKGQRVWGPQNLEESNDGYTQN